MEERIEIWIVTSLSILASLMLGLILKKSFSYLLQRVTFDEGQRHFIMYVSDFFHAFISTFMLIIGTYEKCILYGRDYIFEYYLSTLLLTVVYRYTLTVVSPNPLSVFVLHWKEMSLSYESEESHDIEAEPTSLRQDRNGVRRRGIEAIEREAPVRGGQNLNKPGNKVFTCLKKCAPSLVGLYFGLYAAIQWLHFAWHGYLTTHHTTKTGILQDCAIILQTGPVQGFLIEAFVTFLFQFTALKLNSLRFGNPSQSYLVTSLMFSFVTTTALYIFIDLTGSFANPLLAYALERECLYDITSTLNHVIVYWFGAAAGTIAFYKVSDPNHLSIIAGSSSIFLFVYFFVPGTITRPYLIY